MNTVHPRHFTRRSLLRGLTASALAAPFLAPTRAAAAGIPNLVVVTWPCGLETGWQPTGADAAYEFKDVLAPLNPFRDKLLVVNGLKGGTNNLILQHSEGPHTMWTGALPVGLGSALPTRASFEQLVAAKIGAGAAYKSLHFGTQSNRQSFISKPYVHFAGDQQPIPAEDDPSVMYKLIFGGAGGDAAAAERIRAEKKSVLDFVSGRLRGLKTQVAASDRPKLDKHEEGIRAIEKSLDALGAKQCGGVAAPTMTKQAAMTDQNFPAVIKLQTDLMVTALQCGVTRVATLQLSNTDSQVRIPGISTTRTVHDAMHGGTTPERLEINRFIGKQLAYLLDRMKAVDVGAGRTLLDDTLVVMSTEMAVGGHWNDPIPYLIAGNGGGYLKMGRFVKVANRPRHTKLLTSLLRASGIDMPTFGDFKGADAEGELTELRG